MTSSALIRVDAVITVLYRACLTLIIFKVFRCLTSQAVRARPTASCAGPLTGVTGIGQRVLPLTIWTVGDAVLPITEGPSRAGQAVGQA